MLISIPGDEGKDPFQVWDVLLWRKGEVFMTVKGANSEVWPREEKEGCLTKSNSEVVEDGPDDEIEGF